MKRKTINAIITKKFNDWVNSIDDNDVKALVKKNTIITGGSIASLINNEKVKDYDVYFTDKNTVIKVSQYYINKFKAENECEREICLYTNEDFTNPSSELSTKVFELSLEKDENGKEKKGELTDFYNQHKDDKDEDRVFLFIPSAGIVVEKEIDLEDCENPLDADIENETDKDKPKYRPIFFSSNAISLSDKVQIIIRFYGDAKKIHENFDYLHATNYWTSETCKLELNIEAYEACHNKELIYVGSKYPVCSLFRMRKFLDRGFRITAGEILKIAMNINEFNLSDVKVLRDQLIGVDSAYFNQLINSIKEKEKIDRCYLTAIINKMYN